MPVGPGRVRRSYQAREIRVRAQNPDGSIFEANLIGLDAVCLQHEMDHLKGKLFVDYLSPLKRMMLNKRLEKQKRRGEQDAVTL
jgi:peptide deformylase